MVIAHLRDEASCTSDWRKSFQTVVKFYLPLHRILEKYKEFRKDN